MTVAMQVHVEAQARLSPHFRRRCLDESVVFAPGSFREWIRSRPFNDLPVCVHLAPRQPTDDEMRAATESRYECIDDVSCQFLGVQVTGERPDRAIRDLRRQRGTTMRRTEHDWKVSR